MSRYSGRQGRGASRLVRELKHDQAEERNEHYQRVKRQTPDTPTPDDHLILTPAEQHQLDVME